MFVNSSEQFIPLSVKPLRPFGGILQATENKFDINKLPIVQLRQLVLDYRVIVLRGFSSLEGDELSTYCERWGEILIREYGKVLDLVVHKNPRNYLFTDGNVPFHWDAAFADKIPCFIFFQCLRAPKKRSGGEIFFCDTTRVLENLNPEEFELWQRIIITYKIKKTAHYGGEVTEPLINKHPLTGNTILRFAEPLNEETKNPYPLFLEISGLPPEKHEQFLSRIIKKLYLPQNFFAHEWEQGDFLIADNNALLHGRNPFPAESGRHLQRVQVI